MSLLWVSWGNRGGLLNAVCCIVMQCGAPVLTGVSGKPSLVFLFRECVHVFAICSVLQYTAVSYSGMQCGAPVLTGVSGTPPLVFFFCENVCMCLLCAVCCSTLPCVRAACRVEHPF